MILLIVLYKFLLVGKRAFTGNLLKEFMEAGSRQVLTRLRSGRSLNLNPWKGRTISS